MEFLRKYYMKFLWHKYKKAYRNRLIELPYTPREVWVEPTNFCNLRCRMCPQSKGLKAPKGYMSLDLYEKILKELKILKTQRINLFMGGESLLHKNIIEMARLAKKYRIPVRLHTNATLLSEKLSAGLLESGALEEISFSFDAEDPDYYEKLRVNGKYEKTLKNITGFLEEKKGYGTKKPRVTVQVIKERGPDGKPKEISKAFVALFTDYPVDRFRKVCFHNFGGTLDPGDIIKYNLARENYKPCIHLWKSFNIGWDGTVVACCVDMNRKLVLGDITRQSVMEIWNGEAAKTLRRAMVDKDIDKMQACSDCDNFWR